MNFVEFVNDARKAVGALVAAEGAAVAAGFLGSEQAGWVTGGIGVANAVIVYLLANKPPQKLAAPVDLGPIVVPAMPHPSPHA